MLSVSSVQEHEYNLKMLMSAGENGSVMQGSRGGKDGFAL